MLNSVWMMLVVADVVARMMAASDGNRVRKWAEYLARRGRVVQDGYTRTYYFSQTGCWSPVASAARISKLLLSNCGAPMLLYFLAVLTRSLLVRGSIVSEALHAIHRGSEPRDMRSPDTT